MSNANVGKGLLVLNDKKDRYITYRNLTVGEVYKIQYYNTALNFYDVLDDNGRLVQVKANRIEEGWFTIVDLISLDATAYASTLKSMNDKLMEEDRRHREPTLEELTRAIDYSLDTEDEDLFLFLHSELNRLGYNN